VKLSWLVEDDNVVYQRALGEHNGEILFLASKKECGWCDFTDKVK